MKASCDTQLYGWWLWLRDKVPWDEWNTWALSCSISGVSQTCCWGLHGAHETATELLHFAAWHIWASHLQFNFSVIYGNTYIHFILDQLCSLSCCVLCMARTEQAARLGSTSSLFCMRCTRTSRTTQSQQRRTCLLLGTSLLLKLHLVPRVENPVPTLSLRITRMWCLCGVPL